MLISLRSQFIAGTAAVLGAGSVAVVGVQQQLPALPMPSVSVALSAFHNPIEQLLGVIEVGQDYIFGTYYNGIDAPTPGAGEANWPFAGFDQTGGDLLNYLLANEASLGFYNNVGLLAQNVTDAGPVIRQLEINLFNYINVGVSGVLGSIAALSAGVWDFPAAALDAFQLALDGQIGEAITVLTDAVIVPIATAGEALIGTGGYILTDFVAKTVAVISAIPLIAATAVTAAVGGATVLAEKTVEIATTWITKLGAGDWEGAWNTAIDGLLGPSGLPGTVLNLTTGAGVQTGPILDPEADLPANFVPSVRTVFQSGVWTVAEALTATAPAAAASPAAETVAAPKAAAALEAVEAPAVEAPAVETPAVEAPAAADTAAPTAGESPARAVRGATAKAGQSAESAGTSKSAGGNRTAKRAVRAAAAG
ncbi:MAG: hypothetical protein KDB56_05290 [Mycobacterium sp.]|nr:hypothetical protein [Mycobacterium sp.]